MFPTHSTRVPVNSAFLNYSCSLQEACSSYLCLKALYHHCCKSWGGLKFFSLSELNLGCVFFRRNKSKESWRSVCRDNVKVRKLILISLFTNLPAFSFLGWTINYLSAHSLHSKELEDSSISHDSGSYPFSPSILGQFEMMSLPAESDSKNWSCSPSTLSF